MCPLCIANIAVLATTSSSGAAALALKKFYSRKKHKGKGPDNENNRTGIRSRSGLSAGVGGCASTTAREGEGIDSRAGRVSRRASAYAVAGSGEGVRI